MTRGTKRNLLVVYGYVIEVVLAGLALAILQQYGSLPSFKHFIEESAASWATFFGVMFAGSLAARLVFFTLNNGDFSSWLEWKNLGGVISGAFLFNVLLFAATMAACLTMVYVKNTWLTNVCLYLWSLAIINVVSFAILVYRLGRLQAVFNFEFKKGK